MTREMLLISCAIRKIRRASAERGGERSEEAWQHLTGHAAAARRYRNPDME